MVCSVLMRGIAAGLYLRLYFSTGSYLSVTLVRASCDQAVMQNILKAARH